MASITAASGIPGSELVAALRSYDEARFDGSEDPCVRMPREVLAEFSSDLGSIAGAFTGACFFHGSRTVDPSSFTRRGILPLGETVESIWATLGELVVDVCTPDEWAEFRHSVEHGAGGHSGYLYRFKTRDVRHHGPFAELVREVLLNPAETGSHDYLGCPEIVEDISACFEHEDVNLRSRFVAASSPVIVKFWDAEAPLGVLQTALWYAYYRVRGEPLGGRNPCWGMDHGSPVPAEDIVAVEVFA